MKLHSAQRPYRLRATRPSLAVLSTLALATGVAGAAWAHDHLASAQLSQPGGGSAASGENLYVPPVDSNLETLDIRGFNQLQTLWQFEVFHGFRFTDRQAESGITFKHQIVDDAGRDYKAVHYDHGNGLAAADVDGDGRIDLYFSSQLGGNELWKNLGAGKFRNVTAEAGVALADRIGVTASFADVDNDGDPDLFVTSVRTGNVLFENDGKGRFKDVSKAAGLDFSGHSSGAVFFDYDRDGKLDLLLTNVGKYTTEAKGRGGYYIGYPDAFSGHLRPDRTDYNILYRNLGGNRFEDVSKKVGLEDGSWSGDASFHDVNGDGFPDLFVLNMQGDNHYFENQGGQRFVDRTAERFPKTSWGAMGIKFFDYDHDGLADLYITDMHSDMSHEVPPGYEKAKSLMRFTDDFLQGGGNNVFGNSFYRNLGDGKFEEISDRIGVENFWPWGLSAGDLNADGWEDLFVASSMNYPFRYGVNSLLLNNRGKTFLDSEFILEVEPRKNGMRKPWFDVDCSGADRAHRVCAGQTGRHTVFGAAGTRSSVLFDLDDDGDVDIVTSEFGDVPQVLVSDLAERRAVRFVKVRLRGTTSNRDGLGATVRVKSGGTTLTQFQDGKSGYLSQSALPLYFGLGDAERVDSIEVLWPSGRKQTVTSGLATNKLIEVVEE